MRMNILKFHFFKFIIVMLTEHNNPIFTPLFHIVSLVYSKNIGNSVGMLFYCGCIRTIRSEINNATCVNIYKWMGALEAKTDKLSGNS
jgi:hypothetical protein